MTKTSPQLLYLSMGPQGLVLVDYAGVPVPGQIASEITGREVVVRFWWKVGPHPGGLPALGPAIQPWPSASSAPRLNASVSSSIVKPPTAWITRVFALFQRVSCRASSRKS